MSEAPEEDLWQVAVAPGDTRMMTLEQLDAAFEAGLVNESTLIAEAGSRDWEPLYVVAGLEPPSSVGQHTVPGPPVSLDPPTRPLGTAGANQVNGKVPLPGPAAAPRVPRPKPRPGTIPGTGMMPPLPSKSPSMAETAAAVVAEAGTASRPPPESAAPPLPPNAFAHLAQEAIAEARAPSAPAVADVVPPAPFGTAVNVSQIPVANVQPPSAPPPPMASAPPMAPPVAGAQVNPTPSAAPPLPADAFAHLPGTVDAPVPSAGGLAVETAQAVPAAARGNRILEWLLLGAAAVLGLLVVLHRNGSLLSISSSIGAESAYLGFEHAVLGEPSVNTPRGVKNLLKRLTAETQVAASASKDE